MSRQVPVTSARKWFRRGFGGAVRRWAAAVVPATADAGERAAPTGRVLQRRLIGWMAALSLVMLLILATPLLSGRVSVFVDAGWFHLPLRGFYARCLAEGEAFDWMPDLFCGFYVSGEGGLGSYHPVHVLLYRWLPLDTAFAMESFAHYPLALIGMYLFLRRHTGGVGALMGAMVFTFCTWYMSQVRHVNPGAVLAHMPWLLWAMDLAVASSGPKRKLACAMIGLLTASQILLGHPPSFWYSLILVAGYAVHLLLYRRPCRGAWTAIVGGNLLGFLTGAVQLFATYSVIGESVRAELDLDWIMIWSVHPSWLWGAVAPHQTPALYFGAVPLMLILWWLTAHRVPSACSNPVEEGHRAGARAADRLALSALILALAALVMALGKYGGLYYLHTLLPVVGKFRCPIRFIILANFGVGVASAVAFARLLLFAREGKPASWYHLCLPWAAVMVGISAGISDFYHGEIARGRLDSAGVLLLLGAALALTVAARGRRVGLFALVVIAAIDLGYYSLGRSDIAKPGWHNAPKLEEWVAGFDGPPQPCEGRIYVKNSPTDYFMQDAPANLLMMRGYRIANGYAALRPTKLLDYDDAAALRVAGVAWYRGDPWKPVETHGLGRPTAHGWRRVPHPLPRARLVSDARISRSPGDDLKRINLETTVLVTRQVELSPGPPGRASILADRPGKIRLEVEAPGRQLLVISESYHSGWRALVDGSPATLQRVNGDFIGCVVEKGSHQLEFHFRPAALVYGKLLSLAGLVVGMCICGAAATKLFRGAAAAN